MRLDVFLARELPEVSRSLVQGWISEGVVTVNDETARASFRLRGGEEIRVVPPPQPPLHVLPEKIPLVILYEDEALIVLDKPAGMVMHPGAGNRTGTLANALAHHFEQISRRHTIRPGIVHRLDKETSGVLVVAKNERVHEALARQFKERTVTKHYLCLVYGRVPESRGVIDIPLGRHPSRRTLISTRARKARRAVTEYEVLRFLGEFSFLKVIPRTGRTHQIRVHFQHLGHPVVGDKAYAGRRWQNLKDSRIRAKIGRMRRHFLHADFLGFDHPLSGKRVSFTAPLPDDLVELVQALEEFSIL